MKENRGPVTEPVPSEQMRYRTILLDLDHTLLDSAASEVAAFDETVRLIGLEPTPELFASYSTINRALWAAVERGETTPVALASTRFEQFAEVVDLPSGSTADPEVMAATFRAGLGNNGDLYPGVRDVLDKLSAMTTMAMITNGLVDVQRRRIERLDLGRYFDAVVISAEVGVAKPGPEIFNIAFQQLNDPPRAGALMVGDSLSSDIQGAINAGVDSCLFAPDGFDHPLPTGDSEPRPTHRIGTLEELIPLVTGGTR